MSQRRHLFRQSPFFRRAIGWYRITPCSCTVSSNWSPDERMPVHGSACGLRQTTASGNASRLTQGTGHDRTLMSLTRRTKMPAVDGCAMEPPAGSLERTRRQRPKHLQPWGAVNLSQMVFHHTRLFIPKNAKPPDGWVDGIYASQNPANCTSARFLLLENDVAQAG